MRASLFAAHDISGKYIAGRSLGHQGLSVFGQQ
jgi:hypothetical protein